MMPAAQPAYAPRHVTEAQLRELFDLWHLARTALSGDQPTRHRRACWAARQFAKLHPEISETAAYKDLSNALT